MSILKPVLIALLVLMAVLIIIKANSFVTDDSRSAPPAPSDDKKRSTGSGATRLASAQFVIEYNGRTERILHYPYTIGSRSDNDLIISDSTVSRHHAQIMTKPTQNGGSVVLIQDLGSLNGTLVNGKPCHEMRITGGETVTLGTTKFVIRNAPTEVSDETMYVRRKF
ncbi:MAG: FHA domain-containing protein [Butyricicoccaceae bacterium]